MEKSLVAFYYLQRKFIIFLSNKLNQSLFTIYLLTNPGSSPKVIEVHQRQNISYRLVKLYCLVFKISPREDWGWDGLGDWD